MLAPAPGPDAAAARPPPLRAVAAAPRRGPAAPGRRGGAWRRGAEAAAAAAAAAALGRPPRPPGSRRRARRRPEVACRASPAPSAAAGEKRDHSLSALLEAFSELEVPVLRSSLDCPFLVLSQRELVRGVPAVSPEAMEAALELLGRYLKDCESRRAVFLADFEGDMPGHGGILDTAVVQETTCIDSESLTAGAVTDWPPSTPGLLLDLGSEACVNLLRRVFESPELTKVSWGADADAKSLLYQEQPARLGVQPTALLDAQLAFSRPDRRLGMGRMLQQVPGPLTARLPRKEQIDFDAIHAHNRRAWVVPIHPRRALYAVDDLHRIEAIIRSQVPKGGTYHRARVASEAVLRSILEDPYGVDDLLEWHQFFDKKYGVRRIVKAVEGLRHVYSLRARGVALGRHEELAAKVEAKAVAALERTSVEVPEDLSWAD